MASGGSMNVYAPPLDCPVASAEKYDECWKKWEIKCLYFGIIARHDDRINNCLNTTRWWKEMGTRPDHCDEMSFGSESKSCWDEWHEDCDDKVDEFW